MEMETTSQRTEHAEDFAEDVSDHCNFSVIMI